MTAPEALIARWREIAREPGGDIDLVDGALLIAADEYPALDIAGYRDRIDDMASTLRARLRPDIGSRDCIRALNHYLFEEIGFAGNGAEFDDPRNSYLNDVIDRRLGIPITLSVLYIEIGQRLGLQLQAISFPGHFLVRCEVTGGVVVLDPYGKGASLGVEDLRGRLAAMAGGAGPDAATVRRMLAPAGPREILARMLRNLQGIHTARRDLRRALAAADRIVALTPDSPAAHSGRGRLHLELECFRAALADFEKSLLLDPGAADAAELRASVERLRPIASRLN